MLFHSTTKVERKQYKKAKTLHIRKKNLAMRRKKRLLSCIYTKEQFLKKRKNASYPKNSKKDWES